MAQDLSDVYTALQNADAAGDTNSAQQLADYIRSQGTTPVATPTDLPREVALGGRAAAEGVVNTLTMPIVNSPLVQAPLYLASLLGYKGSPSQWFSQALTSAGAPVPQTSGEKLASAGIGGATAALTGGGLMGMAGFPNALRAGLSGASSGISQEGARQAGLPPWLQIGAGIAGGQLPAFLESTASLAGNIAAPIVSNDARNQVLGAYLRDQAQDPADALANLRSSVPIVPGSMPTAGSASEDLGLLGVEKQARGFNPEGFAARASDQNLARQSLLSKMGGTPQDIEAATTARSAQANALYGNAGADSAPIDSEMAALMQRPAMQAAIKNAQDLAQNRGRTFGLAQQQLPDVPMSLTGTDLVSLRQSLTDMRDSAFRAGNNNAGNAIAGTLDDLKDWTLRNVPSARAADAAFQTASAPINRMQSIQDLQSQGSLPALDITTGQNILSPAKYSNALDRLQGESLSSVGPLDMSKLESIRRDLQNSSAVNALKAPGSDTFQNFMASQQLPGFAGKMGGNAMLSWLYKKTGVIDKLNSQLSESMLNPGETANLMTTVPRKQFNYGLGSYDIGTFFGLSQAPFPTK